MILNVFQIFSDIKGLLHCMFTGTYSYVKQLFSFYFIYYLYKIIVLL